MDDFRGGPAHGRGVSRRTVAKGIAWSVPAVVVASAAPAYAASSAPPSVSNATACKNPGGSCKTRPKGYSFFVTLCNPDPTDTIYMYGGTVTSIQLRDLVVAFLVLFIGGCAGYFIFLMWSKNKEAKDKTALTTHESPPATPSR